MPSLGGGFENIFGKRSLRVGDTGGDHGHLEPALSQDRDQRRQVPGDRGRLDVAALAESDIDAVESDACGGYGQFFVPHEFEVLGEDRDLQLGRRARDWDQQDGAGSQHGTPGNGRRYSNAHGTIIMPLCPCLVARSSSAV
jgi:hypothetical protein